MSGIISLIKNHKKKSLFCALLFILAALIGLYIYIYILYYSLCSYISYPYIFSA